MSRRSVRIAVVGGLTRLEPRYRAATSEADVDTIDVDGGSLEARLAAADAIVLVIGHISHSAAAKVRTVARRRGTPVAAITGSSVSRVSAAIALASRAAQRHVPHGFTLRDISCTK